MQLWSKTSYNYFQIILFSGFLFGFFLPLSTKFSNAFLIIFLVGVSFLVFKKEMKFNNANLQTLKYSTLILIIPSLFSFFFHGEIANVLDILGRRITYLLVPISLLFFSSEHFANLKKYSLKGIVYGGIISSLVLLIINLYGYYATRPSFTIDSELLNFYHTGFNFTRLFDLHPSYFGMYLLLSVAVLLFGKLSIPKGFRVFIVIFFFIIILFLNSRIILLFYFIMVLVSVLQSFLAFYGKARTAVLSFFAVVLIISFSGYLLIKDTYIYTSLTKETLWELSYNVNNKYNYKTLGDSRVARWNVAMDLIKDKPLLGYGIGNEKDVLEKGFRKEGMVISAGNRYDAHNLFLGYAIELGIIGFLLLSYYLLASLFIFLKFRKSMHFLFFLSVLGICLIEDYLNNNAAVTFIAFYGNLFLFQTLLVKTDNEKEV